MSTSTTHLTSDSDSSPQRSRHRPHRKATSSSARAGSASFLSSIINLLNTIVGAGVLAMPLALSHMGLLPGVCIILFSGLTAGFGLYLQSLCAKYLERGSASFFALSQITYPNAAVVFDAAIAVKCFGVGVSYLIIIGDLMPGVILGFVGERGVAGTTFLVDRQFWITGFMLVCIPLSFLRRLDSLKYTSVVALVSIGYLVILVVYHFAAVDTVPVDESGSRIYASPLRIWQWAGIVPTLASFPVIVFAYTCHQNMFSILNEIKDNSHRATTGVVGVSIGGAAAIYVLVAVTGYLSFGNEIGGNIVAMYAPSVSATVGRAAIVVLVMFSYPLQVHPCRASVDAVLKWRPRGGLFGKAGNGRGGSSDSSPSRGALLGGGSQQRQKKSEMGDLRFAAITTAIIVMSYIVAMTVSSLESVLAYVGSTGSTSISFILPGLFYYKISGPDSVHQQRLAKEEDDFDADDEDDEPSVGSSTGLLGDGALEERRGLLGGMTRQLRLSKSTRRTLLRRLSLALAVYGVCVMVICLTTHIYFQSTKD